MEDILDYNYADNFTTTGYDWNTTSINDTGAVGAGLFAFMGIWILFCLAISALIIVSQWKIFKKAGRNGWEAIIPIYNMWVMFEIVGMKGWYALLAFIPIFGSIVIIIFSIMASIRLAKAFGKDAGYAVGLILLPIVFYPMLAFGKDNIWYGVDENGETLHSNNNNTTIQQFNNQPHQQYEQQSQQDYTNNSDNIN